MIERLDDRYHTLVIHAYRWRWLGRIVEWIGSPVCRLYERTLRAT